MLPAVFNSNVKHSVGSIILWNTKCSYFWCRLLHVSLLGNSVWNWMAWLYDSRQSVIQRHAPRWPPLSSGYSSVQHTKHPKNVQQ